MPHKNIDERREYARSYGRDYYKRNRQHLLAKQAEKNKRLREKQRQWLIDYKKGLACVRCGENHPATLQFHHRNYEEKEFEIALYTTLGISKARLLAEIEKCDVICANCHAKEHWSHMYVTLP
jgi:acetylornithine/succinyldiaminopimelate/putrescine aminotransferase